MSIQVVHILELYSCCLDEPPRPVGLVQYQHETPSTPRPFAENRPGQPVTQSLKLQSLVTIHPAVGDSVLNKLLGIVRMLTIIIIIPPPHRS